MSPDDYHAPPTENATPVVSAEDRDSGSTAAQSDPAPVGPDSPPLETDTPCDARKQIIYGLLNVADTVLAINALHIREATPLPEKISPMAANFPGLMGAMILREETIPLVDLCQLLALNACKQSTEKVVIVTAHKNGLVGLVVDALRGMTARRSDELLTMDMVGHGGLTAGHHNFVYEGLVVGILEPDVIFEMSGLPYSILNARGYRNRARIEDSHRQSRIAYLLCSYQEQALAFSVRDVHATIPMSKLGDSPVVYGYCDGVINYHGNDIPVVDTLQVLGLGQNFGRPERSASVALRFGPACFLSMEIDRFYDIAYCDPKELSPLPRVITHRADLFSGVLQAKDGRHFMVVDVERCREDSGLKNLALSTQPEPGADEDAAASASTRDLYLTFRAAGRMACLLIDIVEIIRLPAHMQYCDVRYDGFMGTLPYRQQLVPVFSVANMMGDYPFYEDSKASILVFRHEGQMFGMAIEGLDGVERCSMAPPPSEGLLKSQKNGEFIPLFDLVGALPYSGTGLI